MALQTPTDPKYTDVLTFYKDVLHILSIYENVPGFFKGVFLVEEIWIQRFQHYTLK